MCGSGCICVLGLYFYVSSPFGLIQVSSLYSAFPATVIDGIECNVLRPLFKLYLRPNFIVQLFYWPYNKSVIYY